jgi:hypothetical protein
MGAGRDGDGHDWTPDDALALEAVGHASAMSRNDPNYVADLEELKRDVDSIANEVSRVTLVEGPGGARIDVGLARPRHRPSSRATALALGRVLEAPVTVETARQAGDTADGARFGQPARHTHYKDDRK